MYVDIARKKRGWLKKTGQTTSYTPASRTSVDDGVSEFGLSQDLLLVNTGQYSGTTNVTVNAKVSAHSNNVVIDKVTGLMWTAGSNAAVFGTGTQHLLWDDAATGEDIFNYCDQANAVSLAGHNDWRIPNILELVSLISFEPTNAGLDTNYFAFDAACWSSNTQNTTTSALGAGGSDNRVLGYAKTTTRTNRLILVRNN